MKAHDAVGAISATDDPDRTIMSGLAYVRNPNNDGELSVGVPLMPLSLGEAGTDFLAVSRTQYFFLEQWSLGRFDPEAESRLGPGEYLDMASLSNCLGGRYVPGIELSYPDPPARPVRHRLADVRRRPVPDQAQVAGLHHSDQAGTVPDRRLDPAARHDRRSGAG